MKNKIQLKNRLICIISCITLLFSIFSMPVLANEDNESDINTGTNQVTNTENYVGDEFNSIEEELNNNDTILFEEDVSEALSSTLKPIRIQDEQISNVTDSKATILSSIKSNEVFSLNGTVTTNGEQYEVNEYYDFSVLSKFDVADWAYEASLITEEEKIDCYCELIINQNFDNIHCLTPIQDEVQEYQELNTVSPALQSKIDEAFVFTPDKVNDSGVSTMATSYVNEYETDHFKIFYEDGIEIAEIVDVANEFERVRSFFLGLGYDTPRLEWFQSKYRVYVDKGIYVDDDGVSDIDTLGVCSKSYTVTNVCSSNITLYKFNTAEDAKETIAHEYFHAIQNAYNKESSWFKEACANWGSIIANNTLTNDGSIISFIENNKSLSSTSGYGECVFPLAIELKYGRDAIRYIYEEYNSKDASNTESELRTVITNGIQATGTADNFYNAFLHMCGCNYDIAYWYRESVIPEKDYVPSNHINPVSYVPFSDSVNYLSSKRYSLEAFSGLDGYIVIEVTYGSDRGRTIFYKEYENASPGYSWQPTTNLKSTYSINLNQTNVEKLSIIVCNIGTSESMNYTVNVQFIPNGGYTTIRNSDRYWENRINIAAGETYEMLVEFNVSGYKTLTTFGGYNSEILLYDIHGNLLGSGGDNGVDGLALLSYNFTSNTLYRIKVSYDLATHYGITKLAIFPVSENYANIESILLSPMDSSGGHTGILNTNEMLIIRTSLPQDRTITFTADCEFDSFIYVIDAWASQAISNSPDTFSSYDDDSAGNGQATITKHLDGYVDYIIILCAYNPQTQSGFYYLTFDVTLT